MQVIQKKLAEIFEVDERTVRNWDSAGCPSVGTGKTKAYKLLDVINWHTKRAVDKALDTECLDISDENGQVLKLELLAEKVKMARLDTENKNIDIAKKRGDVVPRELAEELVSEALGYFSQALDLVPYRYPNKLAACNTDAERRSVLKNAVQEVRQALVMPNFDTKITRTDDDEAADPTDD